MASKGPGTDFTKVLAKLDAAIHQLRLNSTDGLLEIGRKIDKRAKELAPKYSGALINSDFTRISTLRPNTVEVGFSSPYALRQHRRRKMRLKGKPRDSGRSGSYWDGGQALFLEKAIAEAADGIVADLAKRLKI